VMLVCSYLLNIEGIRIAPTFFGTKVLRVEPPLVTTREMCDRFVDALARALGLVEACDTEQLFAHFVDRAPRSRVEVVPRPELPRPAGADEPRWGFVVHPLDRRSYLDMDAGLAAFDDAELDRVLDRLREAPLNGMSSALVLGSARIPGAAGTSAFGELVAV